MKIVSNKVTTATKTILRECLRYTSIVALKISSVTGKYHCPVCGNRLKYFLPIHESYQDNFRKYGWKYKTEELETMNDEQYHCPFCWASDRERLAALYIGKYFPTIKSDSTYKILHFAPARPLSRFIKRLLAQSGGYFSYRTADLFMEEVDDKVDITNMTIYGANQFDFFICSHILEHVKDDKKAMSELHRILKPGGRGILMVPIILTTSEIDEDPSVTDIAERWRRFGQHDHLRVHSKKGFIERVLLSGFLVHQLGKDFFGEESFARSGITSQSVLYVVEKPVS